MSGVDLREENPKRCEASKDVLRVECIRKLETDLWWLYPSLSSTMALAR